MDTDERLEIDHLVERDEWGKQFKKCRVENLFLPWVSSFHPDKLPCSQGIWAFGSYNWCNQVIFTNGEKWMVRTPRGGCVDRPDEKVENEVTVMMLLHQHTTIPVPKIKAWGLSNENPLGLGPYIMTEFVEGESLSKLLREPSQRGRLMRQDLDDQHVEKLYRQICHFQLQLSMLNFPRIGGFSHPIEPNGDFTTEIKRRPMSWKVHDILHDGGVDVFGPPESTFGSASEYLNHLAQADLTHLHEQPNSGDDDEDAGSKFRYWKVMPDLVPRMCLPEYEKGPFKLICDDFNPGNMIVNNAEDLEIVAVIDWEWSYAGPSQLFWTAPSWLMMQTPSAWDEDDWRFTQYKNRLKLYLEILEQEEEAYGYDGTMEARPSTRVRQTLEEGRWWYHCIIVTSFNGPTMLPFRELTKEVAGMAELLDAVPSAEVHEFVEMKKRQMEAYKLELAEKRDSPGGELYRQSQELTLAQEKAIREAGEKPQEQND